MANLDSDAVLHEVRSPTLADQARAAWVLVGVGLKGGVPERGDVADVLGMLGVTPADVLRHRPRGGRRVVRKRG